MKKLLNIEMSDVEFDKLMCEQSSGKELKVIDGKVVAIKREPTPKEIVTNKIQELKTKLEELDYIGIKIATGRGTREEYAKEIELMTYYANEINNLKNQLTQLS